MQLNTLPRKLIFIGVLLALKALYYFMFVHGNLKQGIPGCMFIRIPDHNEFFSPVNNLIDKGVYALGNSTEPYAGRLPGFVFPYLLFRLAFSQQIAYWLMGIFIIGLSLFAALKLARLLTMLGCPVALVVTGVLGIWVLPYYWHWDWTLHPASLSVSCLVLCIYYTQRYLDTKEIRPLLYAGFFIAWLFMLRGFTFLFFPAALLVLFVFMRRSGFSFMLQIKHLSLFLLPFIVAESAWVTRNFISFHQFIPLQTSFIPGSGSNSNSEYGYNSPTKYSIMKLRELISCWGGDNFWYFKNADMKWFISVSDSLPAAERFKPVIFKGKITPQSLDELKQDVLRSYNDFISLAAHDSLENVVISKSGELAADFKKNNAFYYYCIAPFKRMGNMVLKNPVQDWPGPAFSSGGMLKKILKLLSIGLFYGTLIGFVVLVPLKLRAVLNDPLLLLLSLYTFSVLATFGVFINTTHHAYFMLGYVPALMLNCILLAQLKTKLARNKVKEE